MMTLASTTATNGLPLLDAALRGALLALLLLMATNLLRLPRRLPLEQVGLGLALGLCVQVLSSWPPVENAAPSWWRAPLVGISMGNAALFWLWVRTLCDDDFQPRLRHALAWLALTLAGGLNIGLLLPWVIKGSPGWAWVLAQGVFVLPLLFALLALWSAAAHWRDDLVERRRWLRAFIVVQGCCYTLLQIWMRQQRDDNRLSPEAAAVDAALLLLAAAAACGLLLRPQRSHGLLPQTTPAPTPGRTRRADAAASDAQDSRDARDTRPARETLVADTSVAADIGAPFQTDPAEDRLAEALQQAMDVQRIYKDPELSVAGLARHLQVPEYRLRRLINQRLGQRNFSAYLNGYRLAEAKVALADPAQSHLPVLTLALESGFGSIGPFNRAFKAETGLTPTDFRRQKLADS